MTDIECAVCEEQTEKLALVGTEWKCPKCGQIWIADFWDTPEN
jgi:transposase